MKNQRQQRTPFKSVLAIVITALIFCTPSVSLGWGAGGHMMTAHIAFNRLTPNARAKAVELLAIKLGLASYFVALALKDHRW